MHASAATTRGGAADRQRERQTDASIRACQEYLKLHEEWSNALICVIPQMQQDSRVVLLWLVCWDADMLQIFRSSTHCFKM